MARIRTIKPEIWMSPQVMNLSMQARLLFLGLITQSDDEGRGSADARRLKAAIFGGDDCTSTDVRRWLDEVRAQRLVIVYESENDGILYQLPSWKAHQSIDRPRPSVYPAPTSRPEPEPPRRILDEPSPTTREGSDRKGTEGKGRDRTGPDARAHARPAIAEVPRETPTPKLDELLPPTADRTAVAEWQAHRAARERPLREHELIAFGKTLAALGEPLRQLATVRSCIANGWLNLRQADAIAAAPDPAAPRWEPPDDETPEEPFRAQA